MCVVQMDDSGSAVKCAKVCVQGIPMFGLIDSAADITIMGGVLFKKVAAAARLKRKHFKPADKVPHSYDHQPFKLDGRMDLEIEFDNKKLTMPIYIKMDAQEQLAGYPHLPSNGAGVAWGPQEAEPHSNSQCPIRASSAAAIS